MLLLHARITTRSDTDQSEIAKLDYFERIVDAKRLEAYYAASNYKHMISLIIDH